MAKRKPRSPKFEWLRRVDLCMIIDTTASMGPFLNAAKEKLLALVKTLREESEIDLKMALVEYRDHPPEERSFITKVYPLTASLPQLQRVIKKLKPEGGGDAPEAVHRGIFDACTKIRWRPHSHRFAFLVGDAPPHGFLAWWEQKTGQALSHLQDRWPKQCPSRLDIAQVCAEAERQHIQLHALSMTRATATCLSFQALAQGTGRPVLLSLSKTIEANKKDYYEALKEGQRSNEITPWITYFVNMALVSQTQAEEEIDFALKKTKFFDKFQNDLNERQLKVIKRMLEEGPKGFTGGMTAKKYMAITRTSKATATRDLQGLVEKGVFLCFGGGRSTRYDVNM